MIKRTLLACTLAACTVTSACIADCKNAKGRSEPPARQPRIGQWNTEAPLPGCAAKPVAKAAGTAAKQEPVFVVCSHDRNGNWWVKDLKRSVDAANRSAQEIERQRGESTSVMQAFPANRPDILRFLQSMGKLTPTKSGTIAMSNDSLAIAVAVALKGDKVKAVAIGKNGKAEVLADASS